ncbi:MAG TPA: proton-conducting transporter membrane subunit [Candidatus Sulfomarinibacteraceae bacterium]|nr:proton-conducting transporter membrane subunit [Candidatus Sulfomarinibacteraceae bacterium]
MPGPLLPILGPLLPALLIFLGLRRWPIAAGISGFLSTLLLRFILAAVPLDGSPGAGSEHLFAGNEFHFLGRALLLTEPLHSIMLLIFTGAALLFLLSALWPQGPDFVPAGLAALSPLSFALQVEPFTFGALGFLFTAALVAPMIQSGRAMVTHTAFRYLSMLALSVPPLLVAGWMLDSQQLALVGAVRQLLALGLLLLLAGFPFHLWIRPLLAEARPLVAVYVLALLHLAVVTFGWQLLARYPTIEQGGQFNALLVWSGGASALLAAFLALGSLRPRRLLAYLILADVGAAILAFSAGTPGVGATTAILVARFASLTVACAGVMLWQPAATLPKGILSSVNRPRWGRAIFLFGALSLAGAPLTLGFAGRWAAVSVSGERSFVLGLVLIVATAGAIMAVIRAALSGYAEAEPNTQEPHPLFG